jgi:organic hydroperoxide reductase OsmC/OhrA
MSIHAATIRWENTGPDMLRRQYSRAHSWQFDGGIRIPASPSPQVVPEPWSDPAGVDPEEAFVASVASCHMLWFLHVLIDAGYSASSYEDHATGEMTRNAAGKYWISRITLRPVLQWDGSQSPSPEVLGQLHHRAHEKCFIAQSIRTEIVILSP